jgi:hypothetical protein
MLGTRWLNFTVKVDFEGQRGGVKYGAAVIAASQMALNFACNLGCQPAFQVFTDQSDCSLARHAHCGSPRSWDNINVQLSTRRTKVDRNPRKM